MEYVVCVCRWGWGEEGRAPVGYTLDSGEWLEVEPGSTQQVVRRTPVHQPWSRGSAD